jgi:hypothetical protein
MCKWNYLKFNKYGEPHKDNAIPKDGSFVWGFCGQDHRVLLCYVEPGYGISIMDPFHGIDDDAVIIAWAEIEAPTMPDLNEFKARKTLHPPILSLEAAKSYASQVKRNIKAMDPPKSKAEAKRRAQKIKFFDKYVSDAVEKCTIIENGYHLPPENDRRGRRYDLAIQTK